MQTTAHLLTAYDREVRGSFPRRLPATWSASSDGPLTRCITGTGGFVLSSSRLLDADPAEVDALVDRTVRHYEDRGLAFEWKTFDHDNPRVVAALTRAGFVPRAPEALVLGPVDVLAGDVPALEGVVLREAGPGDLPAVAALEAEIWGSEWGWFVPEMTARLRAPEPAHVVLAEAGHRVVSAAWLVPMPGTACAGLWGGSTLPAFRGLGIYRALVRMRANEARRRGYTLVQVDASDESRPILERLGLTVAGSTTPYWWSPART